MSKTALVAVGGNSLIRAGEKGTIAEQLANTRRTAAAIRRPDPARVSPGDHARQRAAGRRAVAALGAGLDVAYSQTLDVCGAASQGEIGYLLAQSLHNELAAAGIDVPVVSLVTQTVVSADDPAMQNPSKPIGPFYSRADAEEKRRQLGWQIVEDAARGYRRVVPSPEPIEIVELDVIRVAGRAGSAGGLDRRRWHSGHFGERRSAGVEAVIDKDRASRCWPPSLESTCSRSRPTPTMCI